MHVGPMARSVADAALLANVLAGPHRDDPTSLPACPPIPLEPAPVSGLRIAWCARPGDLPVAEQVARNAQASAEALAAAGACIEQVAIEWRLEGIKRAMWGRGEMSRARAALALREKHPGELSPYTIACLERSLAMSEKVSPREREQLESRIREALLEVLERFDALLIPTMAVACMEAGVDYDERPLLVDELPLEHFCDAALTPMLNIAGTCPVVAVPSGLADAVRDSHASAEAGLVPTGVQVIGRPFDDRTAFRVAAAIEATRPWRYL